MRDVFAFLSTRLPLLIYGLLSVFMPPLVAYLTEQDMQAAWYASLMLVFFLFLALLTGLTPFLRRRRILRSLLGTLDTAARELPEPGNAVERDYAALVSAISRECDSYRRRLTNAQNDTLEYYTLWIHQIKTPIAAMRLVLEQMQGEQAGLIRQELFKVEQYADLALRYARLTGPCADVLAERCELLPLIRASVKKFGVLFVYQKLYVHIEPIPFSVISDRKWLSFIIEQVLSNAVKYTKTGGVTITSEDGALVIADTGIGIRPEDLPRIFERGYTGINGRIDSRASGIGLYLAKKAADSIGVTITVASKPGEGTRVTLRFPAESPDAYL